ncbi:uncharacterized protein B0T23DRAFT_50239 [Neurospora hispaniola]|uniref:Uncharacterized protein n=1 Tax=Neurospora hispaniola TaxID=588809 RepID=A0AAJ0MM35_9PEZI|nr:hypothetical protein B0T23DRAFT_50239 [Neurospora hispaniola]
MLGLCWCGIPTCSGARAQHRGELVDSYYPVQSDLENGIRRRIWHGYVILDLTVSRTYGRPTMTAHLDELALPSIAELDDGEPDRQNGPSSDGVLKKMYFYLEHIQQCHTIGEVFVHRLPIMLRPTN